MLKKLLFCLSIITTGLFLPMSAHAGECQLYETTHPGYPLDGAHLQGGKCSMCASCHTNATFVGTPKTCDACHGSSGLRASVFKSSQHFPVIGNACSDCHNTTSYSGGTWSMNHTSLATGVRCDSCHNGSYETYNAQSKNDFVSNLVNTANKTHLITTADCIVCHAMPTTPLMNAPVTSWQGVNIATIHATLTLNSICSTCHDGNIATGKNAASGNSTVGTHPQTNLECGSCHSFTNSFKCAQVIDKLINYAAMAYLNVKASVTAMLA